MSGTDLRERRSPAEELEAEAADLARRLGVPSVRTAGASGVLDPRVRGPVWVHGRLDVPELLAELTALPLAPDLMLLEGLPLPTGALREAGWEPVERRVRVRRDPDSGPVRAPGPALTRATAADLPEVRALHDAAFGAAPGEDHLPDEVLHVPGLRVLLHRDAQGELVGTVGLRTRVTGVLLFGLAVREGERRRGAGTALVASAVAEARAAGHGPVLADADPQHAPFWTRAGFRAEDAWQRWCWARA